MNTATSRPALSSRRFVKHFDFNEGPWGNFSTLPMNWRRHVAIGFPTFLEGRFDHQVGRQSPPSFRLDLDGESIAYHYEGRDIAVQTNSDYLIVAWIRTESLTTARAYLSAYYLDREGTKIPGTECSSELIGGTDSLTDWELITVALQGNVPKMRYIGLTLWLTQAGIWDAEPKPMRFIQHEEVKATAWFDDITVYRLPRAALETTHPGRVFSENEQIKLRAEVSDPDGLHLSAELIVRAADGRLIDERAIAIQSNDATQPDPIAYDDLPLGLYHAELIVRAADTVLVHRALRFARLASRISPPVDSGRGFGVILDQVKSTLLPGQRELIQELHTEYVKIPVWYAQQAAAGLISNDEAVDRYLEAIVAAHADPIGILMDDPGEKPVPKKAADKVHSMVDLLSADPISWKPWIAGIWSRHAGLIHVWQVGDDGNESVFLDHRLSTLIPTLRREMKVLVSEPLLATTSCAHYGPDSSSQSDYQAVMLPASVPPEEIGRHLKPLLGADPQRIWVTVESLAEAPYPRKVRLADLSRRLVEAYFQKIGGVFLARPWDLEADLLNAQINPREDFIILRTIADLLGGSTPISHTTIDGQAQCMVFDRNKRAILFVWDEYAPAQGREHNLYLGEGVEQIDLWGRRKPIQSIGARQIVRIGPMPTFIVNSATWLMEFRRQFGLEPILFEASFDAFEHQIVFRNTYHEPISGILRLIAPADWEARPSRFPFALAPGEQFRQPISVRFPQNADAGVRALVGDFTIQADQPYRLFVPAWFELGLKDIELRTYVFRTGDRVVVRQSMSNQSTSPITFDGYVVASGRRRINHLFANCLTGQSITKDFILKDADELSGKLIRVGLKEVQGPRVWNRILEVP